MESKGKANKNLPEGRGATKGPLKQDVKEGKKAGDVKTVEDSNFRHLVRVSGVVLDGKKDIKRALTHIKGIGYQTSKSIVGIIKISPETKLGSLDEKQTEKIEDTIKNLHNYLPPWRVNHRNDRFTGKNFHLTGSDLDLANREDINLQKKLKSYRGIRHSLGLPVRGQRTRTSFRHGPAIGVSRKKEGPATVQQEKTEGGKK